MTNLIEAVREQVNNGAPKPRLGKVVDSIAGKRAINIDGPSVDGVDETSLASVMSGISLVDESEFSKSFDEFSQREYLRSRQEELDRKKQEIDASRVVGDASEVGKCRVIITAEDRLLDTIDFSHDPTNPIELLPKHDLYGHTEYIFDPREIDTSQPEVFVTAIERFFKESQPIKIDLVVEDEGRLSRHEVESSIEIEHDRLDGSQKSAEVSRDRLVTSFVMRTYPDRSIESRTTGDTFEVKLRKKEVIEPKPRPRPEKKPKSPMTLVTIGQSFKSALVSLPNAYDSVLYEAATLNVIYDGETSSQKVEASELAQANLRFSLRYAQIVNSVRDELGLAPFRVDRPKFMAHSDNISQHMAKSFEAGRKVESQGLKGLKREYPGTIDLFLPPHKIRSYADLTPEALADYAFKYLAKNYSFAGQPGKDGNIRIMLSDQPLLVFGGIHIANLGHETDSDGRGFRMSVYKLSLSVIQSIMR